MPVYEYKCEKCGGETERIVPRIGPQQVMSCDFWGCNGTMKLKVSLPGRPDYGFRPFITEHITGNPIEVESRSHKKRLLAAYNLQEAA